MLRRATSATSTSRRERRDNRETTSTPNWGGGKAPVTTRAGTLPLHLPGWGSPHPPPRREIDKTQLPDHIRGWPFRCLQGPKSFSGSMNQENSKFVCECIQEGNLSSVCDVQDPSVNQVNSDLFNWFSADFNWFLTDLTDFNWFLTDF